MIATRSLSQADGGRTRSTAFVATHIQFRDIFPPCILKSSFLLVYCWVVVSKTTSFLEEDNVGRNKTIM